MRRQCFTPWWTAFRELSEEMVRSFWEVGCGCGLEEEFIRHQLAAEPSQENIHAGGVGGGEVWRGEARSQLLVMKR